MNWPGTGLLPKTFRPVPTMPKEPHPNAALGRVLGDTGSSQVIMVRQAGGMSWADASPAWSESTVPTIMWVQTDAGTSKPYRVNAPRPWFSADRQLKPGERARILGMNLLGYEHNSTRHLIAMKHRETRVIPIGRLPVSLLRDEKRCSRSTGS
jgi:hypothetical protein